MAVGDEGHCVSEVTCQILCQHPLSGAMCSVVTSSGHSDLLETRITSHHFLLETHQELPLSLGQNVHAPSHGPGAHPAWPSCISSLTASAHHWPPLSSWVVHCGQSCRRDFALLGP